MVDYELFKRILQSEDEGYIAEDDTLDKGLMQLMAKSKIEKVKSLFKKCKGTTPVFYYVEMVCGRCGKTELLHVSKSKTFQFIQSIRQKEKHICNECELAIKAERRRNEPSKEEIEKTRQENTDGFISRYLTPLNAWKAGIRTWQKIDELTRYLISCDRQKVAEYIKDMPYDDFLLTPYWKAIAEKVRYRAKHKCQLCNGTEGLSVHHSTYEHHGDELNHLEDLICLCRDCHEKFHERD